VKTERITRLVVLISDVPGSGLDARARALFARLPKRFDATLVCHRGNRLERVRHFLDTLRAARPDIVYIVDPIYAAVAAIWLYRATHRTRVVVDTGDLVYQVAREMGQVGWARLAIVNWAEQTALRMARAIVVRGSFHRELLLKQGYTPSAVTFIPDGVDLSVFHPMDSTDLRGQLGFRPNEIVVGGVGTIDWSTRRRVCFGWDLIESLSLLRDLSVKAILIGDGNGRSILEARAKELGVADGIAFTGCIPYAELPRAINAMDICLLTQLNTPLGWVRTTGKLPLYLACDRYIIASQVGEAARVLEPFDMFLPYVGGGRDVEYPLRLAEKIRDLTNHPEQIRLNGKGVKIARQYFDYDALAKLLEQVIDQTMAA
jgi:glycosyltransferase involved in cell wall biosynthesis